MLSKEAKKVYDKTYYKIHREERCTQQKAYNRKIKLTVFNAYGGPFCACCKEEELSFLSIDHMDGGGNKHRHSIAEGKRVDGQYFYRWLIKNNFPPRYQVLCMNCQFGRKHNKGICPHQQNSIPKVLVLEKLGSPEEAKVLFAATIVPFSSEAN